MFLHDFSKGTLERRQELIPEMLEARKQGKIAYMVMDKLIIHDRMKPDDDNSDDEVFVNTNKWASETLMFLLNRELNSDLIVGLQAFQYQLIFILHYSCVVLIYMVICLIMY